LRGLLGGGHSLGNGGFLGDFDDALRLADICHCCSSLGYAACSRCLLASWYRCIWQSNCSDAYGVRSASHRGHGPPYVSFIVSIARLAATATSCPGAWYRSARAMNSASVTARPSRHAWSR